MTRTPKLNSFLENIKSYQFPEFQRAYVWGQGEIYDLIDTIVRGYSAGMILIWNGKKSQLSYSQSDWIEPDVSSNSQDININYILDGQQRIKTLSKTFGIDCLSEKGYKSMVEITSIPRSLSKYPKKIFPSRTSFLNVTRNKSNRWVSFDTFLDITKIDLSKENWHEKISTDSWTSIRDIIKLNWKKETVTEYSIVTETRGKLPDLEFYVVEFNKSTIIPENNEGSWYSKQELVSSDKTESNTIKPVRFIYLNSLKYIEDIIECLEFCNPINSLNGIQDRKTYFQTNLRRNLIEILKFKPEDIELLIERDQSLKLGQLSHYFSRINKAGVVLDVVDLLIAIIYGEDTSPFPLRTMLDHVFEDSKLLEFFNLKTSDDPNSKFKILLQIASLYHFNSLSDDNVLDLRQQKLKDLHFHRFEVSNIPNNVNILIRESWRATIELLQVNCGIESISKLRYDRIFVVLVAIFCYIESKVRLNNTIRNNFMNQVKEILKIWLLRESISTNLATGSHKPPARYSTIISKTIPNIRDRVSNNQKLQPREILDDIFIPSLSDENLEDKEIGKPLMSILLKYGGIFDFFDIKLKNKIETHTQVIKESIELHHVFPKKIINDENLRKEFDIGMNLTPIMKDTNSKIDNIHPFKYISDIIQKISDETIFNEIMKSHCLPDKDWWESLMKKYNYPNDANSIIDKDKLKEQFEEFILERKNLIIPKFKDVLYLS